MHSEYYCIGQATVDKIKAQSQEAGVWGGTTSVRVLETSARWPSAPLRLDGHLHLPGFFSVVDAQI